MTANADEAEYWSGPSGQTWITWEREQDALLASVSDLILERSAPETRDRVLEIGPGTGALTLALGERVGPDGRVLAADISPLLLGRLRERASGMPQVETIHADAQTADWPERDMDLAVTRFGVMFFDDPAGAFANIARALRPGGRMVFAAWGDYAENPWWTIPQRIAAERLERPPALSPHAPGPFGLSDAEWSLAHFRTAGLQDAACEAVTVDLTYPDRAAAVARLATKIGPAARVLRLFGGTDADREAIETAIAEAFAAFETSGVVRIPARLHLYTATAG